MSVIIVVLRGESEIGGRAGAETVVRELGVLCIGKKKKWGEMQRRTRISANRPGKRDGR